MWRVSNNKATFISMKIKVLILILVSVSDVFAQEITKKTSRFSYGITLSPAVSKVKYLNDPFLQLTYTAQLGIGAGATVKYDFNGKWFVLSGVSYKSINSKMSSDATDFFPGIFSSVNFTSLEIPWQFNYKINPNGKQQSFIGLGVIGSKLLTATNNITTVTSGNKVLGEFEIPILDSFNDLNMFVVFAAGVEFQCKGHASLLLSLSVDRNLFEMVKPRNNSSGFFDYSSQIISIQQRLTNFSLNVTYLLR